MWNRALTRDDVFPTVWNHISFAPCGHLGVTR